MSSVEEVPFKIPLGALGEVKEEVEPVSAPDITVPDYLTVLQETEYAFRLENWVLTGLQGGYPTQPQAQVPRSPSDVLPTCPPYWMMFSSPQESRLASRWSSDLWEPNPLRRCRSLNASHLRNIDGRVHFTISDSDNEEEEDNSGGDVGVTGTRCQGGDLKNGAGSSQRFLDLPGKPVVQAQSVPSRPQQQNQLRNLRQASLSARNPPRPPTLRSISLSDQRSSRKKTSITVSKKSQAPVPTIRYTKPSVLSLCSFPRPPPACGEPRPLGSHAVVDSSVELLSALSDEERDLVEAITEHGYSLRTAIIALQKTREHSSEQILNYLVACNRLCGLGYDEAEVEEALEMFQNCETKAEEFLQLLNQFNEMGFQQNAIKEVLLVHENHRERALEELMTRVA
ncbi:LOW QUALITY PROTEIN: ubiquitin-associated protein 1-like [Alosa alosa]|uniref:LOW QUALITY PROTEIN: ubiquitin-associated protein 1-like n=1 Tax=Alosa alosa TaxID=278164 RepID=UPI0020151517|nr:LOW QUALITY PROTEIN: ubiquitin-associated protein 1-like [Alosa alosa]